MAYGAFEPASRHMAVLAYVWNITPPGLKRAIYFETLILDALHLTTFAGAGTERDEIEARLFDLDRRRYKARKDYSVDKLMGVSTKRTHLPHLYLEGRFTRDWLDRSPLPSDMASLYIMLIERGAEDGLWLYDADSRISDTTFQMLFEKAAECRTLARVAQLWISAVAMFDKDPLQQLVSYGLLPVLVAKAGLSPLPPLSVADSFSPKTYANRASFEEKMVYVAGVLERSAAKAQSRLMRCHHQVETWSTVLAEQGYGAGKMQEVLPWLCFRQRIRAKDLVDLVGVSRMQAGRLIERLMSADIIKPADSHKRNRSYTVLTHHP